MKRVYLATVTIVILADEDQPPDVTETADLVDGALCDDSFVIDCVVVPAKVTA